MNFKKNILLYTFCAIIIFITFLDVFNGDKKFSELENRNLARKPELNFNRFLSGKFSEEYERYINDEFIFRNIWIDMKSKNEKFLGKVENNNIILGKNKMLFDKVMKVDEERVKINVEAINKFIDSNELETTIMIVPNSYEIYKENLYYGLNIINQENGLYEINESLKGNKINLLDKYKEVKDDYIYYKTDHHWTSYGAYIAYKEFVEDKGMYPVALEELKKTDVDDFYGTYFSRAKDYDIDGDVLTYYEIPNIKMKVGDEDFESLYDYSKLEGRDKYEIFIRGNNPLTIIKNEALDNEKKLLIFKDSYANSLIPFLTQNYEEIHVIDLRSFGPKVSKYIEEYYFDDVLILYNFANFILDMNVVKIKY